MEITYDPTATVNCTITIRGTRPVFIVTYVLLIRPTTALCAVRHGHADRCIVMAVFTTDTFDGYPVISMDIFQSEKLFPSSLPSPQLDPKGKFFFLCHHCCWSSFRRRLLPHFLRSLPAANTTDNRTAVRTCSKSCIPSPTLFLIPASLIMHTMQSFHARRTG